MRQLVSEIISGGGFGLRRSFILVGVFMCGLVGAATAPDRAQEKPPIPPDLYFEFKEVPAEENAIVDWRRAPKEALSLDDNLGNTIAFCWKPTAPEPSETDLQALESWLQRNRQTLDLFATSLKKPHAQWLVKDDSGSQPELATLNYAAEGRLFEADRFAAKKDFSSAVDSLEGTLKLAQLGVEGDAPIWNYRVSARVRLRVQNAIKRIASRRELPLSLMERLIKDLPSLNSETNTYQKVLRVEFTKYAYHPTDVQEMAESWSQIPETDYALLIYPIELRRPFKVLVDPLLVAAHPNPVNEITEIKKTIGHYRVYLTNSVSAWSNRNDSVEVETDETVRRLLAEIKPLMEIVKNEPLPLSRQAAERARKAYLLIENPIGRITDGRDEIFSSSDTQVFKYRTERESARAVLGLLLFERKKGVLPGKLSELVGEGILDSIPFDYFANAPLCYSRDRRVIWSVSEDGSDDGGKSDHFSWYTDDAVWQIPKIN